MSTKIYNGYAMPEMTLQELFAFCAKVRDRMSEAATEAWRAAFMEADFRKGWSKIHENVCEADRKGLRHPLDFKAEAVFIQGEGKLLVITFWEQKHLFTPIWLEAGGEGLRPYHYWDNVDPDDDVPYDAWEARGKEWDRVLGWEAVSLAGFSYTFSSGRVPWPDHLYPPAGKQ